MTSTSIKVCIDKIDDIVNEHNNTYHGTIKMTPVDVKSSTYTDFAIGNNDKDPKFEICDHIRISEYKNSFVKAYVPNWSEEVFVIKKLKILRGGHMFLVIFILKKL